eukprot:g22421.t1
MNRLGFGAQGQQTSQDWSFHVGTVCRAPIKMSYFVAIFFVYELVSIGKQGGSDQIILWQAAVTGKDTIVSFWHYCF